MLFFWQSENVVLFGKMFLALQNLLFFGYNKSF